MTVPAMGNAWPRRWMPAAAPLEEIAGGRRGTGVFDDAFGNRMTVLGVANPRRTGRAPARLHDLAPGYGIIRFDSATSTRRIEVWPRGQNPKNGGKPFDGMAHDVK